MREDWPNNWEDQLRYRLLNHNPNWEKEELWGQINQKLPPKHSKPIFFWAYLFVLLVLFKGDSLLFSDEFLEFNQPPEQRNFISSSFPNQEEVINLFQKEQDSAPPNIPKISQPKSDTSAEMSLPGIYSATFETSGSKEPNFQTPSLSFLPKKNQESKKWNLETKQASSSQLTKNQKHRKAARVALLPKRSWQLDATPMPLSVSTNRTTQPSRIAFSVETYTSISKPFRNLTSSNPDLTPYLDARRGSEQILESWEIGALMGLHLKNAWSLHVGVERQQLTEWFQWTQQSSTTNLVQSDSAFFYLDDSNQKQYLPGEVESTNTITRAVSNYNRMIMYHVPFLVGMQHSIGKWDLIIRAGGVINLQRRFEGLLLETDLTISEDATQPLTSFAQTSVGLGWQTEVGAALNLNQRNQIVSSVFYRNFPGSFSNVPETGFTQRYQFLGLKLGWRYRL